MNPIVIVIIILSLILCALVVAYFASGQGTKRLRFDIGGFSSSFAQGGSNASAAPDFRARIRGVGIFSSAVIVALFSKLWSMQVLSSSSYTEQAETNRRRTITLPAPRGRILDRNGRVLVGNRPSLVVTALPSVLEDDVELRLLSNVLGIPEPCVRLKIADASAGAQSPRVVSVDVSRRVVAYINAHPSLFPGVAIEDRTQRAYPLNNLCAHVLGYTGTITDDQLKAAKENNSEDAISYVLGDTLGQAGIEAQYENVLQGIKGEQTVFVDADGNVINRSGSIDPQSGSDVVLTIDADIQKAAEDSLNAHIERLRGNGMSECYGGCALAMEVETGEILAMASAPSFSPSLFVGGISYDDWQSLSSEKAHNPLLNRSMCGQYPSASTIKPFSSLAALDYGIATPESSYVCTGYWTGLGSQFGQYCWLHSGHGRMTIQTGITNSCDVVFYEIGKAFFFSKTQDGMQKTFKEWGLGAKTGIDLPGELEGRVPDAAWKEKHFANYNEDARKWQGGDLTNLAIGQGDLLVTPLQMLSAYATFANGGVRVCPHLMKSIKSSMGTGSVIDYKAPDLEAINIKQEYFDVVKRGLVGVIYEESQAQASHFTNMKEKVAGKTGTAETSHTSPTGWFIAYAPVDHPKYVVASMIEDGGFGADGALYVVRDILGALFGEPDSSSESNASHAR